MKKNYCWGLFAGVMAVFGLTFVSCGDDDEIQEKDNEETEVEQDVEAMQTALSSDGMTFNADFVKIGESISVRPYGKMNGQWVSLSGCKLVDVSYDKSYVRIQAEKDASGNIESFEITGSKETTMTTFVISYTYEGEVYTSEFQIQVLGPDEDEVKAKSRAELRSYIALQVNSSAIDLQFGAATLPTYMKSSNGDVMVLTKGTTTESYGPVDNFRFRPSVYSDPDLYPGCLVYINKDLANGKFKPVNFGTANELGKVNVFLTVGTSTDTLYEKNVDRSASAIRDAIGKLVDRVVLKGGSYPGGTLTKEVTTTSSVNKVAIDLGVSASVMGAQMGVSTSTTTSSTKMYCFSLFTQEFYTVGVEPAENNDVLCYLGDDVDLSTYKAAESTNGKIGIIRAVTYGRYGWYKKEYESNDFTFKGSDSISYSGASVTSKQDISKSCVASNEKGEIVGGNAKVAADALTDSTFEAAMKQADALIISKDNQGVPIFFAVQYLSGDKVQVEQNGSCEELSSYVRCPHVLKMEINANACNHLLGTYIKPQLYYRTFKFDGNVKTTVDKGVKWEDIISDENKHYYTIALDDDVYFEPVGYVGLRAKVGSSSSAVKQYVEPNLIYIGDGDLKLKIGGSTYSGGTDPYYCREQEGYDVIGENTDISGIQLPVVSE